MPRRSSRKDFAQLAFDVFQRATREREPVAQSVEPQGFKDKSWPLKRDPSKPGPKVMKDPKDGKNPAAVALGSLGGKKGGVARARALSRKRRVEIAKKAAKTRWAKKRSSTA